MARLVGRRAVRELDFVNVRHKLLGVVCTLGADCNIDIYTGTFFRSKLGVRTLYFI